ncbi:glycoprotein endo-alpha-1,2-mannosidase [Tritrichomonas foetus]|uniref:Glycoprotein endo-alpha-1,2-mannosidase n=1 Tax=Tritrichomonas foetus TaxID=1144522 RepID=A0A1J4L528_9EUKA|nr:glycoprotein endo-alpha-1,2-mannosidase [Tritrichomonas foetus]|eukprot:OHT17037.1 glycoprotein endo-alpha-1,2-mannosidase [Tritrichomonas foetus]
MSKYLLYRVLPVISILALSFYLMFKLQIHNNIANQSKTGKQVWIFYSGWWGGENDNPKWAHWRTSLENYFPAIIDPSVNYGWTLFPKFGLYSSHDESLLRQHLRIIQSCKIDAIIFDWWGLHQSDYYEVNSSDFTTQTLKLLFNLASDYNIKIGVCIQTYANRTKDTVMNDILFLKDNFWNHPSMLKIFNRPVLVIPQHSPIEDIHLTIAELDKLKINPFLISSVTSRNNIGSIVEDGFDALLSYYGSPALSWISNSTHWEFMKSDAIERGITFIPTVSPGFFNQRIFDKAVHIAGDREAGKTYNFSWENAISINPQIVTINSFNNWTDATNIEPPIERGEKIFDDYNWLGKNTSSFGFIELTKYWISQYKQ